MHTYMQMKTTQSTYIYSVCVYVCMYVCIFSCTKDAPMYMHTYVHKHTLLSIANVHAYYTQT